MNNKSVVLMSFVLGAVTGALAARTYLKGVYEQIAQEEIDSVKEVFLKREAEKQHQNIKEMGEQASKGLVDGLDEYSKLLRKEGYITTSSDVSVGKEKTGMTEKNEPYIIPPEAFGELEEYDTISLTYYSNNVLADENDDVIEDVEETVGVESLTHFGEYEDDSVFVRNDVRKCDYEILLDQRSYSDVINKMPHRMEEE